jgi:hypothetical protein
MRRPIVCCLAVGLALLAAAVWASDRHEKSGPAKPGQQRPPDLSGAISDAKPGARKGSNRLPGDAPFGSITRLQVNAGDCNNGQSFNQPINIRISANFNAGVTAGDTDTYRFTFSVQSQNISNNPPSTDISRSADQDITGNAKMVEQVNKNFSQTYGATATSVGQHRFTATLTVVDITKQPPPPPITLATSTCVYTIK